MATSYSKYIGLDEAVRLSGLKRKDIVAGVHSGRFPHVRQGKNYLINPMSVMAVLHAESSYDIAKAEPEDVELPPLDEPIREEFEISEPEQEEPAGEITAFTSTEFGTVRTVVQNGEPWFVAADVCKALDLEQVTNALRKLDDDEKGTTLISIKGGNGAAAERTVNTVNEPGLYSLVLSSRKPEAKAFKRWITHEVIPSIRKHGAYMTQQTIDNIIADPSNFMKLVGALADEKQKTARLTEQNTALTQQTEKDRPKVVFAESFKYAEGSITVSAMAKILASRGYDTGEKRFYQQLRDDGYICKTGDNRNLPTSRGMAFKPPIFTVDESVYADSQGVQHVAHTTKITPAGQTFFIHKYCGSTFLAMPDSGEGQKTLAEKLEDNRQKALAALREKRTAADETIRRILASYSDEATTPMSAKEFKDRFPDALKDFQPQTISRALNSLGIHKLRTKDGSKYAIPTAEKRKPIPAPIQTQRVVFPKEHPTNLRDDLKSIMDEANRNPDTIWKFMTVHEFIQYHPILMNYLPHAVDMMLTNLCIKATVQYNKVLRNLPCGVKKN